MSADDEGPKANPEASVLRFIAGQVRGCRSILDIGSGLGAYLNCGVPFRAAVDAYAPYLARLTAEVKMQGRAQDVLPRLGARSFDAVICIDMIEHTEKAEGLALLAEMARIAARVAVVFTPLGFHPQDEDGWGLGGDHWQKHRSGWVPGDFAAPWQPLVWPAFTHGKPDLPAGALWAVYRAAGGVME